MRIKKYFLKYINVILCLIFIFSTLSVNVSAGTSASTGAPNSGGGGGGSTGGSIQPKMGQSVSEGLRWEYHDGNVDWSTSLIGAANHGGTTFSAPAIRWACVSKPVKESGGKWYPFRWRWFRTYCGLDWPAQLERELYRNVGIWKTDDKTGKLQDVHLIEEAVRNGFYYDTNLGVSAF